MTNYEALMHIEISGVKPFLNIDRYVIADTIGLRSCCQCWMSYHCQAGEDGKTCRDTMLDWLSKEAEGREV